jgi:hypothetical protein
VYAPPEHVAAVADAAEGALGLDAEQGLVREVDRRGVDATLELYER